MSGDAATDVPIGKQLYDQGWRQGSLFNASPLYLAWNDAAANGSAGPFNLAHKKARAQTRFVLITQDCDLISGAEDLVEALACATQSERFIARVQRNSARWFVIDPAARLVANVTQRIQLTKRALATLTPQPWPGDEERRVHFVQWLGRRYTRPAMPDAMVEAFQKSLEAALYRLTDEHPAVAAAFNRVVHDLRVSIPDAEEPPYDLQLVILIRDDGLTAEEGDAIQVTLTAIRESVNPDLLRFGEDYVANQDEMPLRVYARSWPVYLEYLSYEREEAEAAPPLRVP